jgi:hypothetical protein
MYSMTGTNTAGIATKIAEWDNGAQDSEAWMRDVLYQSGAIFVLHYQGGAFTDYGIRRGGEHDASEGVILFSAEQARDWLMRRGFVDELTLLSSD